MKSFIHTRHRSKSCTSPLWAVFFIITLSGLHGHTQSSADYGRHCPCIGPYSVDFQSVVPWLESYETDFESSSTTSLTKLTSLIKNSCSTVLLWRPPSRFRSLFVTINGFRAACFSDFTFFFFAGDSEVLFYRFSNNLRKWANRSRS